MEDLKKSGLSRPRKTDCVLRRTLALLLQLTKNFQTRFDASGFLGNAIQRRLGFLTGNLCGLVGELSLGLLGLGKAPRSTGPIHHG